MREIDLRTWSRRDHFALYSAFDYPHFSMSANVDLTDFYTAVKPQGYSISVAIMYVIARAANAIPEFRYRIRNGKVIEHERVHPSTTILTQDDLFSFCTVVYREHFPAFAARAAERIASVKANIVLDDGPWQDELLFMTAIPWVSFTSFVHPTHQPRLDSVPRFAWGRFFQQTDRMMMPLNCQAHHALMDGLHMGRFYEEVQSLLSNPTFISG